eukprot:TRINITY_DN10319_c0_g2_i1.p1 TRINITY_DN10319_c0_g2~~TRINITY_DN10319_c0_g2_i1.p1  ORF type:complete len:102 (+),score=0.24 TRINITY_DN10319_c0_g2_i1:243-548(+)
MVVFRVTMTSSAVYRGIRIRGVLLLHLLPLGPVLFIHLRTATCCFICICSDILLSSFLLVNVSFDFSFHCLLLFWCNYDLVSSFCSLFGRVVNCVVLTNSG